MLRKSEGIHNKPESCQVIEKRIVAPGYCRVTFRTETITREAHPGQFVMVYMPSGQGHMLPRPFSIFRADRDKGELSLLFEVKGRGTELLSRAEQASTWKLLGPLGRGFPSLPPKSLLVAGGMGVAPLVFLAASTKESRNLVYGATTADQLICPPADLVLPGLTLVTVTEDGSSGERGTAVDLCLRLLPEAAAVFACGPKQMLSAVALLTRQSCTPAWISIEERMACGIGACLGCVAKTSEGYRRVCCDGPVFPAGEVVFNV